MRAWVLADSPACKFYEKLRGQKVETQLIDQVSSDLQEVVYGWTDIKILRAHSNR